MPYQHASRKCRIFFFSYRSILASLILTVLGLSIYIYRERERRVVRHLPQIRSFERFHGYQAATPLECANNLARTAAGTYFYYSQIPKTGGTTSYEILKDVAALTNGSLVLCPYRSMKFQECNLILSHFNIGKLPKPIDTTDQVFMTTLRNPVALTLSSIRWMVQVNALDSKNISALVKAFKDFRACREVKNDCPFISPYRREAKTSFYNMINRQSNFLYYPNVVWQTPYGEMLNEFSHVGITEFRYASRCLLMYQFQAFDTNLCKNACGAEEPWSNPARTKIPFPSEIFSSVEYISRNDNILYAKALSRFMHEVSCIEQQFNVTLICRDPHFDPSHPAIPFKPAAYNVASDY